MRFARILALLLALATFGVSAYYLWNMPFVWLVFVPANIGVLLSLYFWRVAPKRKKARKRAAMASVAVVPFLFASAVISLLLSPVAMWPVFLALTALGAVVAGVAIAKIERKQSHIWADYYSDVT